MDLVLGWGQVAQSFRTDGTEGADPTQLKLWLAEDRAKDVSLP